VVFKLGRRKLGLRIGRLPAHVGSITEVIFGIFLENEGAEKHYLVVMGNFANAVKAKQGATTDKSDRFV